MPGRLRSGWVLLQAAFFLLATALPSWPQTPGPSVNPHELVTTYLILAAGRAGIVGAITANLAEKREIDRQLSELDAAAAKRKQEITGMSAFCQGTFSAEEVARRRKICEDKQKELDESSAAADKLRAEIKQRDKERQAEALKLKTAYDGLGQRAKAIEPAIAQHAVLKPLFDQCSSQSDLMARAQCLADSWAAAAPKPKFPEPPVPLGNALPQEPDLKKVSQDWAILELAAKVYGIKTMPGQSPFAGNQDWKMLEIADARALPEKREALKATGFRAYSYVNEQGKTLVIAVQGSRAPGLDTASHPDTRKDFVQDWWENDVKKALIQGRIPPQFEIAREYLEAVKQAYADKYTIICTGHSLGGGACAYAAGREGVRAVVINPISSGASVPPANAHLIDNYVVEGELANTAYGIAGRAFVGRHYRINNYRESPGSLKEAAVSAAVDHGADTALDNLARQVGIERIK